MSSEKMSQRRLKTELHLHLEGALTARRALALAETAIDVPPPPEGAIATIGGRPQWSFGDLGAFLRCFGWGSRLLRGPDAYLHVFEDLVDSLRAQEVERVELFVAFGQMHRAGIDPVEVVPALASRARALEESGELSVHFVADATRQWGVREAELALDRALSLQEHRIVGFSMGGDERAIRAREFRSIYRRAREAGLGRACHAGEGTSADAVREVVDELEVTRVGHGIAATADADLLRELAEEGIVLEVCPTSNERTGVWAPRNGPHPLLQLLAAEVPVVIGSDDPAFFGCTLASEEARLRQWGVEEAMLERMEDTARAARFSPS